MLVIYLVLAFVLLWWVRKERPMEYDQLLFVILITVSRLCVWLLRMACMTANNKALLRSRLNGSLIKN